jgi:tRNA uridine 5-carboxymethylaminomethyl modification enzyme
LAGLAHKLGLIGDERAAEVERRTHQIAQIIASLDSVGLAPNDRTNAILIAAGATPLTQAVRARDFLCRTDGHITQLQQLGIVPFDLIDEVAREVETAIKYEGYVSRQESEVHRLHRLEHRTIPPTVDYATIEGLRSESKEKLSAIRPRTIGQASRIGGIAPTDISILLVHLERERRQVAAG